MPTSFTSSQAYTDDDGMSRMFTNIDYSKKSKLTIAPTAEEMKEAREKLTGYRAELVDKIVTYPASICPIAFSDFTIRGEDQDFITWNIAMLSDEGMPIEKLMSIKTLIQNKYTEKTRQY